MSVFFGRLLVLLALSNPAIACCQKAVSANGNLGRQIATAASKYAATGDPLSLVQEAQLLVQAE
jgi:hypothetical protein